MTKDKCGLCEKQRGHKLPMKKIDTQCFVCKKKTTWILDLHHTNAHLCSLECEQSYWLDILY